MKLEDIDVLVSARMEYSSSKNWIERIANFPAGVQFNGSHVDDHVIVHKIKLLCKEEYQKKLTLCVAKLATLGVEVPE